MNKYIVIYEEKLTGKFVYINAKNFGSAEIEFKNLMGEKKITNITFIEKIK